MSSRAYAIRKDIRQITSGSIRRMRQGEESRYIMWLEWEANLAFAELAS
jgi:hypothetical protein